MPSVGSYDFTIRGAGFSSAWTVYLLECTIPGGPVFVGTPAEELAVAVDAVERSDCDLSTASPVVLDSEGSFVERRVTTVGTNFIWVVSDASETQTTGVPVLVEQVSDQREPAEEPAESEQPESEQSEPVEEPAESEQPEPVEDAVEPAQPEPDQEEPAETPVNQPEQDDTATDTTQQEQVTPEPEPELESVNPSIIVAPAIVPYLGGYDFTIAGSGFIPDSTVHLMVCTIPGDTVSPETPAAEIEAAMGRIEQSDCDLDDPYVVVVEADGSFIAAVGGTFGAPNFAWAAGDASDLVAAAPVFTERHEYEPEQPLLQSDPIMLVEPTPESPLDFVWVFPRIGIIPSYLQTWPLCSASTVPPFPPDCTPRAEWQRGDGSVNPHLVANDFPRASQIVVNWYDQCTSTGWDSCRWLLHEMHQALDYLGADPVCVTNQYRDKFNYLLREGSGANRSYARDTFGWHNCATVIDPIVGIPPAGRFNDIGYRLSDTIDTTLDRTEALADRCRRVLTDPFPDIELESRGSSSFEPPYEYRRQPIQFGQDCDAWAAYIMTNQFWRNIPGCAASLHLAEEWMEHVHGQNDRYYRPLC